LISDRSAKITATEDENADGRVDVRDDRIAEDRVVARAKVDERQRLAADKTVVTRPSAPLTVDTRRTVPATTTTPDVEVAPAGPRPRASLMSTLALVFGVCAALTVLTGVLAGPGIGLGVIGALFGVLGVGATGRRHVAGKADAMLGLVLAAGAVVVGILAFNGMLPWLTPETDQVGRVREWLASELPWLFPS
jgi:hypothetical protein